ncbi:MAG TPA: hypothetical protein VGL91_08640 [Acidobacteriota bacterium]
MLFFLFWLLPLAGAASTELRAEPQLVSVFPLGGRQGTTFCVEIRGKYLHDVSDAWFDCGDLKARIQKIEKIETKEEPAKKAKTDPSKSSKPPVEYLLSLEIDAAPQALPGAHYFRLISPGGISNALLLQVSSEPVVLEDQNSTKAAGEGQEIHPPVAVNGKISEAGEVDYYSFTASKDDQWLFEIRSAGPGTFDPVLTLYQPLGSWLDPKRLRRLAMNDEPNIYSWNAPRLSYRFTKSGRYIVAVEAFSGVTTPHCAYQLRLVRTHDSHTAEKQGCYSSPLAHNSEPWKERDFLRKLDTGRIDAVFSRTLKAPERSTTAVTESEPNDEPAQALSITIPALLEGTINRPGDRDYYKFTAGAGEGFVFEIQTPEQVPYQFMPKVAVFDGKGEEIVNNVYRKKVSPETWLNLLEPKTVYTFAEAGDYYLQVRDLTSRNADSNFSYRILVRKKIPHVGEVKITEDYINLHSGQARKVSVTVEQEEGFDGFVTLFVENLPPGVQVFPAAEVVPEKTGDAYDVPNPRYVPKANNVTLMFVADPEAPPCRTPYTAAVKARAVVGGKTGELIVAKQILFMVVRPEKTAEEKTAPKAVAQK